MRLRCAAAVLVVCGIASIAGCPALDLGGLLGSGSSDGVIPDGTYAGDVEASVQFWEWDSLSDEFSDEGWTDAKFAQGALLQDSGEFFYEGTVDFLGDGVYEIEREVISLDYGDWGYEIEFALTAEYDGIPMSGWEIATYWLMEDGTLELYDEIELTSEEWYDGGMLTIYSESYSTMERGTLSTPSTPADWPGDILDKKSGKVRR